jgi:hypothetical protein
MLLNDREKWICICTTAFEVTIMNCKIYAAESKITKGINVDPTVKKKKNRTQI